MNYWQARGQTRSFPSQNNAEWLCSPEGKPALLAAAHFHPLPALSWLVLISLVLLSPACSPTPNSVNNHATAEATSGVSIASATLTALSSDSSVQADPHFAGVLNPLLDSRDYSTARWGVAVRSLRSGKLLYGRNGDKLFTPASNMKIYTTAVALDLLGPDYRWRTSVYSDEEPDANGTIRGDLVLYGRGAPDLISANRKDNLNSLEELAAALAKRGVKHVAGNVIGDESYFRGEAVGQGWQWNDLQWYFGAEASALSINANSAEISIKPPGKPGDQPSVVTNDSDGYIQISNKVVTVERGGPYRIGIQRGLSDNNVVVWGEFPFGAAGYGAALSVHRPALWAARLFIRALRANGIGVDGAASSRDWHSAEQDRFNPENKRELASVSGKSLAEIVKITNKHSVNLYAELILRTLGRERGSLLPSSNIAGRERGDEEAGAGILQLWLARRGVNSKALAFHDGSGLSRLNLVTPESTTGLLAAIRSTNAGQAFMDSLPIAATDGTLQGRLKELSGKVLAKTGALTYDNSLSGYLTTDTGDVVAFSVICNDYAGTGGAIRLIDRLVTAMASDAPTSPSQGKHSQLKAKP